MGVEGSCLVRSSGGMLVVLVAMIDLCVPYLNEGEEERGYKLRKNHYAHCHRAATAAAVAARGIASAYPMVTVHFRNLCDHCLAYRIYQ